MLLGAVAEECDTTLNNEGGADAVPISALLAPFFRFAASFKFVWWPSTEAALALFVKVWEAPIEDVAAVLPPNRNADSLVLRNNSFGLTGACSEEPEVPKLLPLAVVEGPLLPGLPPATAGEGATAEELPGCRKLGELLVPSNMRMRSKTETGVS
jgi:hypothetical protein